MPWYRTGTVAVTLNSTTVTGTGTNFAQNSRVGDAFQGPDGRWYEVTNIASATVISITPNYLGATATGQSYSIAPLQGYVKQSADSLRTITNQYGTTLGLLGTPTDTAGLRSNIGAAKSGANNDITSITGLTTALSIAQGGTGGTSPSAVRTNIGAVGIGDYGVGSVTYPLAGVRLDSLDKASFISASDSNPPDWSSNGGGGTFPMGINLYRSAVVCSQLAMSYGNRSSGKGVYWRSTNGSGWDTWDKLIGRADVVGTVSQTGGVPTGAVIERGSNANGNYVRFADGTQICWGTNKSFAGGVSTSAGSNTFISGAGDTVTWPQPFYDNNSVVAHGGVGGATPFRIIVLPYRANSANGTFTFQCYVSVTDTFTYNWTAIGRWFA